MIHGALVGLLIVVQTSLELFPSLSLQWRLFVEVPVEGFARLGPIYIIGFAVIAMIQRWVVPGPARKIVLIASVLIIVAVWGLWQYWMPDPHFILFELGLASPSSNIADGLWISTTYLLIAAWYYESADRAARTTAALRESELARQGEEQWLLEFRLRILQARLGPQVLFDTLDHTGRLYRSRPAAAEELLDAVIDYLRRALPQMRRAESTLATEVALAAAYARVLRSVDGEPIELSLDIAPAVRNARLPPMVLQPICSALAHAAMASEARGRLEIAASRENNHASICVTAQTIQVPLEGERLAQVRRTLESMFTSLVRMNTMHGPTAGVISVVVQVPYVEAARADC